MFLLSLLTSLYGFLCFLIIITVLYQRGKGNMGLGNAGGGNQALFGSSGGQDIFQKATWVFCFLLLAGSLVLSVVKGKNSLSSSRFSTPSRSQQSMPLDDYPMSDEI
ncbi:MAG: preprotein translocase subunit SecG [Candidatus Dependentiae bacterium]|nr:preprotein translocase subunit SecG [Candidatus Dependentiae bacterium]